MPKAVSKSVSKLDKYLYTQNLQSKMLRTYCLKTPTLATAKSYAEAVIRLNNYYETVKTKTLDELKTKVLQRKLVELAKYNDIIAELKAQLKARLNT